MYDTRPYSAVMGGLGRFGPLYRRFFFTFASAAAEAAAHKVDTGKSDLAGKKREELEEMRDNLDAMLKDHPDPMM